MAGYSSNEYGHDALGRVTSEKRGLITQHVYDTSNRLTSQSWRLTDGSSRTETYTYNSKDGTLSSVKTASGQTVSLTYDYLKRLAKRTDGKLTAVYGYTDVDDARTTTQVNKLRYEGISGDFQLNYTYDSLGNITQVKRDSTVIAQYAYDAQGQLIQERLTQLGILYEYSYDTGGNLRTVKTTKGGTTTTKTYSYTDGSWKDLLTAVDGKSLTYDAIGNPLTYYNGQSWTFTWKDGRQLATAKSGDTSVSYNYDAQGLRTSKAVGSTTYYYVYLGDKLVRQTWGSNKLDFAYDEQGRPYSMTFNGTTYFYVLNLQGDVISLVDASGAVKATYTYDAWGNAVVSSGALVNVNPLRYRGYYYDFQTQMYYLNSRYYDPANRRFISADETSILYINQEDLLQYNLFVYSFNNPIVLKDNNGQFPINAAVGAVIGGIWCGITAVMTGGDVVSSVLWGAVSGGIAAQVGAMDGVCRLVKGVVGGVSSLAAYYLSSKGDIVPLGAATAFGTGFVTSFASASLGFTQMDYLVNGVTNYLSTVIIDTFTRIADTAVKTNRKQNTTSNITVTAKKRLSVVRKGMARLTSHSMNYAVPY